MLSTTALRSIVQGAQFKDPRIYDALMGIIDRLQEQAVDVQEIQRQITTSTSEVASGDVAPVEIFSYTTTIDYLVLEWEQPDINIVNYELRYGSTWETAERILVTNTTSAVLSPVATGINHTYLIKSIATSGLYSLTAKSLTVNIPAIGAPSLSSDVIDNNILLSWSAPASIFRISHYIIRRNGTSVGTKDGTFTSYFETVAGTYTYSVQAVDISGNLGTEVSKDISVNTPPDYVLEDLYDSDFSGTKVNSAVLNLGRLLFNVDITETFEGHFDSRGWSTIQEQIDAGYSYYIQPSPEVGTYQETIDYTTTIVGIIVNLDWAYELIAGDGHDIVASTRYSLDDITYSGWVEGTSVYIPSFRYLQVKLEATARN